MSHRSIKERMLSAIRPTHGDPPPARWQQRKSAQTRQRLVDGGVQCLIQRGYAGLTTAAVAELCEVSRGAMHHHFATRLELVGAVIEHVLYQRMHRFLEDYFTALKRRGEELLVEIACESHWQSVQTNEYAAYLELTLAARTDVELAELFNPASRRYDQIWIGEMIEAFPQWKAHWDNLKLANDVTLALHMGMLLHRPVFGEGERMAQLQQVATRIVQSLYDAP